MLPRDHALERVDLEILLDVDAKDMLRRHEGWTDSREWSEWCAVAVLPVPMQDARRGRLRFA
jgi:hypothetical protein